jgi:hypothetical protein
MPFLKLLVSTCSATADDGSDAILFECDTPAMGGRVHTLMKEAWHLVLLVVLVGLGVGAVAALLAYGGGKRGDDLVLTATVAVGAIGVVSVAIGVASDPMTPGGADPAWRDGGEVRPHSHRYVAGRNPYDKDDGLPAEEARRYRRDDMLYAGGVLLIGLAVLIGYACSWAGVPPANPLA